MNGHSVVAVESSPGEAASKADFAKNHKRRLALFVRRNVGDPRAAQEIEQETWAAHFRRWSEHRDQSAALFGIAWNLIKDWYSARGVEASVAIDDVGGVLEVVPPRQRGLDPGAEVPVRVDLERAVGKLCRRHREVMVLRCVYGLSIKETAAVLGVGAGTVREYYAEAKIALRQNPNLAGYGTGRTLTSEVTR